ncbi:MAG: thymidylate synthase [bacterium]
MNIEYTKAEVRTPDFQYRDCLATILREGVYTKHPNQTHGRYTKLGLPPMVFKLKNGFPVITERDLGKFWWVPIGELLAFINGARTLTQLEKFGCKWWKEWATTEKCADFGLKPGDLGPGSYGAAFHDFPNYEWTELMDGSGKGCYAPRPFNQFENVIQQIKESPSLATHKVTSWIPQFCIGHSGHKRKVVVAPCHGDVQITILNNELTLHMSQRSGDFPIGVPSNMIQYAALTLMIAHVTGFEPHEYMHYVVNAQIYENQVESAREIIMNRRPTVFPSVYLNEVGLKITNLFDFRPEHFELHDYYPKPAMKIPTTI